MNRRSFLRNASLSILSLGLYRNVIFANSSFNQKTLILIELKGGNDGLNTVAPLNNKYYLAARPNIALNSENTFEIGEVVAWIFNNEMTGYRMK